MFRLWIRKSSKEDEKDRFPLSLVSPLLFWTADKAAIWPAKFVLSNNVQRRSTFEGQSHQHVEWCRHGASRLFQQPLPAGRSSLPLQTTYLHPLQQSFQTHLEYVLQGARESTVSTESTIHWRKIITWGTAKQGPNKNPCKCWVPQLMETSRFHCWAQSINIQTSQQNVLHCRKQQQKKKPLQVHCCLVPLYNSNQSCISQDVKLFPKSGCD